MVAARSEEARRLQRARAMAKWILSAARLVAVCGLGGAMGLGCAVGAGPGATHDDLHDGDDAGGDDTGAYGLFDADPMDSARDDTGVGSTRDASDAPAEAAPPVEVGTDVAPADTA